jgi:hypothetical protein
MFCHRCLPFWKMYKNAIFDIATVSSKQNLKINFYSFFVNTLIWLQAQSRTNNQTAGLMLFSAGYYQCLLSEEKAEPRSRGRPSEASLSAEQPCSKRRCEVRLPTAVCLDTVDHLPSKDNNQHSSRCKNQNFRKKTQTYCKKCNIHLCFTKDRNFFEKLHKK